MNDDYESGPFGRFEESRWVPERGPERFLALIVCTIVVNIVGLGIWVLDLFGNGNFAANGFAYWSKRWW